MGKGKAGTMLSRQHHIYKVVEMKHNILSSKHYEYIDLLFDQLAAFDLQYGFADKKIEESERRRSSKTEGEYGVEVDAQGCEYKWTSSCVTCGDGVLLCAFAIYGNDAFSKNAEYREFFIDLKEKMRLSVAEMGVGIQC